MLRKRVLAPPPAARRIPPRAERPPEDIAPCSTSPAFPRRLSQCRRDARAAHRRARRQRAARCANGSPAQDARARRLRRGLSLPAELPECAGLAQGRPRLPDRRPPISIASTMPARASSVRAIGGDAASPWQKTARYLVARCAVHAAIAGKTPKLIADARQAIDAVAGDPELAAYHADAPKLAALLAFATRPQRARAGAGAGAACARPAGRARRRPARSPGCWSAAAQRYTDARGVDL